MKTFIFRIIVLSVIILAFIAGITVYYLSGREVMAVGQKPPQTVAICGTSTNFGDVTEGKELFNSICAACHRKSDSYVSFKDFTGRYGNSFFLKYVAKEDSLVKSHNENVKLINQQAGEADHVHGYDITAEQANSVLAYLDAYQY